MLEIRSVVVEYPGKGGAFRAVDGVSLTVRPYETLALVGESGSGKTSLVMSLFHLLPHVNMQGAAFFEGQDLFALSAEERRRSLGRDVGLVFQNPYHAFDPVYRIGAQICEVLDTHFKLTRAEKQKRVAELLETVELDAARVARLFPHELSGGMLQRAQLALALCCRPKLLIADEPTSALDVTVQAQILALLGRLKQAKQLTLVIITHDLGVVAALADTVAVMQNGHIVEYGPVSRLLNHPTHPFTQKLLQADLAYR